MSEKRKDSKGRLLRNGEVQRPDGKYMFRYVSIGGERKTIYSWKLVATDKSPEGKGSRNALRDMEKQIARDIDDGIQTDDAKETTVDDLFKRFIDIRVDLKTTTKMNYTCLYNKHIKGCLGRCKIDAVRFSMVQQLYLHMLVDEKLKVGTIRSVHAALYQIFEMAVRDHLIRENPTKDVFKTLKRTTCDEPEQRHALTEEEQSALLTFIRSDREFQKWVPLITVLLGTGMRIGEALGLQWYDCNFTEDIISVDHTILYKQDMNGRYEYRISEPKTRAGIRQIPMFSEVKAVLLEEREKPRPATPPFSIGEYTDFIFLNSHGKVYTPGAFYEVLQNIYEAYNRKEFSAAAKEHRNPQYLPKISAHILRHTFCTRLCENGANIKVVQDVMGHKNCKTTMDVYNEATLQKKKASFKSLNGIIKLA